MDSAEIAKKELTLRNIYRAIKNLEADGEIELSRLYLFESPYIKVVQGTAGALIDAEIYLAEEGEETDVDQVLIEDDWLQIWSQVVFNLAKLPQKQKLEIYEFIGGQDYLSGTPLIDDEGNLIMSISLPCGALTPEYAAHFVSRWVQKIDEIDNYIAEKWDGLTVYDEGPDQDQGSATHARY